VTHDELVERAARWLRLDRKCGLVATEPASTAAETPDAIGWRYGSTTVVECKASRGDFRADAAKPFRQDMSKGMGDRRYFMTPPGLVRPEELPAGWGLVEVHPRQCITIVASAPPMGNRSEEALVLVALLRAHGRPGRIGRQSLIIK
jgi:hypothetical protein